MEVDLPRQRIGLSMRLDDEPGQARGGKPASNGEAPSRGGVRDGRGGARLGGAAPKPTPAPANSAFADALAKARQR
jgi:uncharacterized protein